MILLSLPLPVTYSSGPKVPRSVDEEGNVIRADPKHHEVETDAWQAKVGG